MLFLYVLLLNCAISIDSYTSISLNGFYNVIDFGLLINAILLLNFSQVPIHVSHFSYTV